MRTFPIWLRFALALIFCPFLLVAGSWKEITPSGWKYTIYRFNSFEFDNGHYDLYVWADTIFRFSSKTQLWGNVQAEYPYGFEGEPIVFDLTGIRYSRSGNSVLSLFEGYHNVDGMGLTLFSDSIVRAQDGREKFELGNCWPSGHFMTHGGATFSPIQEKTIYCAYDMHKKIHRSTNGGEFQEWSDAPYKGTPLSADWCIDGWYSNILEASPFDTNVVFISGYPYDEFHSDRLYRTNDNGQHWAEVCSAKTAERPRFVFQQLLFHPTDSTILFLRTDSTIYRSMDAGSTWKLVLDGQPFFALGIARHEPNILFAGSTEGRLYRSIDGGLHWQLFNNVFSKNAIIGLYIFPEGDKVIAAAADGLFEVYDSEVSVNESFIEEHPGVEISPNPSSASLTIRSHAETPVTISFLDLFGREVRRYAEVVGTVEWDGCDEYGRHLAPGLYFCTVSTGTKTSVVKVWRQ